MPDARVAAQLKHVTLLENVPHQAVALETVRGLERRAYAFAASLSSTGQVRDSIRRNVEAQAAANPLADMNLVRETATDEFASELAADRTSGLAVLGDLKVTKYAGLFGQGDEPVEKP